MNCDTPLIHLNEKLKKNVQSSGYFKELYALKTFEDVLYEIKSSCNTIETYQKGSMEVPSKFMCLFYKCLLMRLTAHQIKQMLSSDHVYVRAMGLLYVRLLCKYENLFDWLSPYLFD